MSSSPTTPGQTSLIPVNDCVLVKLDAATLKETKYSTRTSGIVVTVPKPISIDGKSFNNSDGASFFSGKRIYFEEYKEGARIKRNNELLCFIKIADIRGVELVETNT